MSPCFLVLSLPIILQPISIICSFSSSRNTLSMEYFQLSLTISETKRMKVGSVEVDESSPSEEICLDPSPGSQTSSSPDPRPCKNQGTRWSCISHCTPAWNDPFGSPSWIWHCCLPVRDTFLSLPSFLCISYGRKNSIVEMKAMIAEILGLELTYSR